MKLFVILIQVALIPLVLLAFVRELLVLLINSKANSVKLLEEITEQAQPDIGIVMEIRQYSDDPVQLVMRAESDPSEHIHMSLPDTDASDYIIYDRIPLRRFAMPFPEPAELKRLHIPLDESGMLIPAWEFERLQTFIKEKNCYAKDHRRIPRQVFIACAGFLLSFLLAVTVLLFSGYNPT